MALEAQLDDAVVGMDGGSGQGEAGQEHHQGKQKSARDHDKSPPALKLRTILNIPKRSFFVKSVCSFWLST
jgi:hypothetical protein